VGSCTRTVSGFGVTLVVAAVTSAPVCARADATKDQCVDANAHAQPLRREGKFAAARDQLRICVDAGCPGIVRDDCAQRLDELERAQPTIVFEAKDSAGRDVSAVRVTVDGVPLVDSLDGTAVAVDPGRHAFTFRVAGQPTVSRELVVREGEKDRRERIVVEAPRASSTTAQTGSAPAPSSLGATARAEAPPAWTPPSTPETSGGSRALALTFGALGVAGVAVGSVYGLLTISKWHDSQRDCSNPPTLANCPNHDQAVVEHDAAVTNGLISTIAFVAGGVLGAAGVVSWLASSPSQPASALRIEPRVGADHVGVALKGGF